MTQLQGMRKCCDFSKGFPAFHRGKPPENNKRSSHLRSARTSSPRTYVIVSWLIAFPIRTIPTPGFRKIYGTHERSYSCENGQYGKEWTCLEQAINKVNWLKDRSCKKWGYFHDYMKKKFDWFRNYSPVVQIEQGVSMTCRRKWVQEHQPIRFLFRESKSTTSSARPNELLIIYLTLYNLANKQLTCRYRLLTHKVQTYFLWAL